MDPIMQAELEAEWNAQYDYIAELRAEHAEDPATLDAEAEATDRYNAVIEAGGTEAEAMAAYAAEGLIEDPKAAISFVLGGNATFTLVSKQTGDRYTFRVRAAKDKRGMYFASTLIGSDNETDYAYLGYISDRHGLALQAGKKGKPDDVRFRALAWLLRALAADHMPSTVEFWHEGRCARCNRKLTDPESIATGYGPECRKHT